MQPLNFIKHLLEWESRQAADRRLNSQHIALYMALFWRWNALHFQNPVDIVRHDIMHSAKIGSKDTYTRCLKQLHQWQYIRYHPSRNSIQPSTVTFIRFDIDDDENNPSSSNTTVNNHKQQHHENNTNTPRNPNNPPPQPAHQNTGNPHHRRAGQNPDQAHPHHHQHPATGRTHREASSQAKGIPQSLQQVKDFFAQKNQPAVEAEKFFNHYQARGWKVNGDITVHDWQAIASNWILNVHKFKPKQTQQQNGLTPGNLHVKIDKDYDEPL